MLLAPQFHDSLGLGCIWMGGIPEMWPQWGMCQPHRVPLVPWTTSKNMGDMGIWGGEWTCVISTAQWLLLVCVFCHCSFILPPPSSSVSSGSFWTVFRNVWRKLLQTLTPSVLLSDLCPFFYIPYCTWKTQIILGFTIEQVETIEKERILHTIKITNSSEFLVKIDQALAFPSVGGSAWGVRRRACLRRLELKSGVAE